MSEPDAVRRLTDELTAVAARLGSEIDVRARGASEVEGQERLL